jgi:GAF domain-containing protein
METRLTALYDLGQQLILLRDVQQIAETVLEIAARVLDFQDSVFLLLDEAQKELYVIARRGCLQGAGGLRLPLDGARGITVAAARSGQPIYVPDVRLDPRYVYAGFAASSELAVPVQIEGRVLGVLNLESAQAGAFSEADQELLSILANQAALALENARLHVGERRQAEEAARRHRELAALYAVAEAVNRPLDLGDLLQHALDSVIEVTQADGGAIRLLAPHTNEIVLAAHRGLSETYVQRASRFPLSREIVGWVARSGQAALSEDMWTDPRVSPEVRELLKEVGHRSLAQVPLRAQEQVVGTLGITARTPGFFNQDDLKLLNAIGQQVGVAIANAQLFEDTRRKAHKLAVLNAVASVVNQPLPLQKIMDQAIAKVIEVMGTEAGGIRLLDEQTGELAIASSWGLSPEYIRVVDRIHLSEGIVGHVAASGEPLVVKDVAQDPRSATGAAAAEGFHTFAVVPLKAKEQIVGTLGVVTRQHREFTAEDMELLTAIGHQIGVAIANDRLRQEALAAERMAAVGRVAASVAHNLRSPLGGILRSAEFLARPELSPDTRQKLSQAIVSLTRRLINTSQEILDYVRGGRLPLRCDLCSLPEFLDGVLAVLEVDFSDRGIEVVRDWRYRETVTIDAGRMAQVVYNIAANARDAMPRGGTFTLATRQVGEWVELRFSDTGPGVPKELGNRIFEPFFTYGKREGAGLGLAIARRIVEEHGGTLRLESNTGQGATFVVSLPA